MDGITHFRLGPDDLERLLSVEEGLFDAAFIPEQAATFLNDPLHEIVLAYDGDSAVGMVTGMIMFHPDKPPAMFVCELGTRDSHLCRGIATGLMETIISIARERGCKGIWLGTEDDNEPALGLYRKISEAEVRGSFFGWDDAL